MTDFTFVDDAVDTAVALPERVVLAYLRRLRGQARRDDPLGAASRTILGAVHGSARDWSQFLSRVQRVSEVPRTTTARGRGATARGGRRTTRSTRRRSSA